MNDQPDKTGEKNLQLERLVFFSDAVVAIAITLLALDIRIEPTRSGHLAFGDILNEWKVFTAFLLSFVNIANFWRTHHAFFCHIDQIDERLLFYNIAWLFFIVTLPFSTSLVSTYFFDTPAIFLYSLNTFLIAACQNFIWDYASIENRLIKKESISARMVGQYQLFCNLDMVNAGLAVGLSFLSPAIAFVSLFTKLPLIVLARMYYRMKGQPFGREGFYQERPGQEKPGQEKPGATNADSEDRRT